MSDFGGGAEQSVLTLHKTFLRMGHQSRLYVGTRHTDTPEVIEIPAARVFPGVMRSVYWLERNLGWQYLYAPRLRRLARQLDGTTDVVHVHTLWGGQYGYADVGAVSALSRSFPTVVTLRDAWLMTGHCACFFECARWKDGCGRCPDLRLQPALSRDATRFNWRRKRRTIQRSPIRVTVVSSWLKTQIEQSSIFAGKPVDVIHNSVDETVFTTGSRDAARAELGVPQDAFVVLLAGQAIEGINQGISQHAIEALNCLNNPRMTALLIGHSAARVAATLRTPSVVLPFQRQPQEMARCYRAADITVVPSEFETFGRVAAESLCCGTPVVAFATGGLTDIVRPGISGWLVPTGDVDGLAQTLHHVFENRDELGSLHRDCTRCASAQFSTARIAESYLTVYRTAMADRRA